MDRAARFLAKIDPKQQVFHVYDIALLLGVTGRTVRRWIYKGELPGTKSPGLWYVLRVDFVTFLNQMSSKKGARRGRK